MKVLGFVNRFSRGVLRVEEELKENGNGKPEFSLNLGTAFMVIEHISSFSNEDVNEEKSEESGVRNDNSRNTSNINDQEKAEKKNFAYKNEDVNEDVNLSKDECAILKILEGNPNATYQMLIETLNMNKSKIYRIIRRLKTKRVLKRINSDKSGSWVILIDKISRTK